LESADMGMMLELASMRVVGSISISRRPGRIAVEGSMPGQAKSCRSTE
jgi:hypothetical protein